VFNQAADLSTHRRKISVRTTRATAMIGWHNPEVAFDPKYAPIVADPASCARWSSSVGAPPYIVKRSFRAPDAFGGEQLLPNYNGTKYRSGGVAGISLDIDES
jgi:hypothetical protein